MKYLFKAIWKKYFIILLSIVIITALGFSLLSGLYSGVDSVERSVYKYVSDHNYPDVEFTTELTDKEVIDGLIDESGVKNDYKSILTKSLVLLCSKWNDQLKDKQIFNPSSASWRAILCTPAWQKPIHAILITNNTPPGRDEGIDDGNVRNFMQESLDNFPFDWVVDTHPNGRIHWYGGHFAFYEPYARNAITFDWDGFSRNRILCELRSSDEITINPAHIIQDNNCFFYGSDIKFHYHNCRFSWYNSNAVYLLNDNDDRRLRPNADGEQNDNKFYCFNVKSEWSANEFKDELEKLIKDFNNENNARP